MADLNINALEATQRLGWASRGGFTSTADGAFSALAADGTTGATVTVGSLTAAAGTITANNPLSITQTWNNGATSFSGLHITTTLTAWDTNNSTYFKVSNQTQDVLRYYVGNTANAARFSLSGEGLQIWNTAWSANAIALSQYGARMAANVPLQWCSSTTSTSAPDTNLYREAAGHIGQRNSTNAQKLSIYNTWASSTDYESLIIDWKAETNVCLIATAKGSSGTQQPLKIGDSTQTMAFWGVTPVVQQVLATGASATVDDVITFLQTVGLCKQS